MTYIASYIHVMAGGLIANISNCKNTKLISVTYHRALRWNKTFDRSPVYEICHVQQRW